MVRKTVLTVGLVLIAGLGMCGGMGYWLWQCVANVNWPDPNKIQPVTMEGWITRGGANLTVTKSIFADVDSMSFIAEGTGLKIDPEWISNRTLVTLNGRSFEERRLGRSSIRIVRLKGGKFLVATQRSRTGVQLGEGRGNFWFHWMQALNEK